MGASLKPLGTIHTPVKSLGTVLPLDSSVLYCHDARVGFSVGRPTAECGEAPQSGWNFFHPPLRKVDAASWHNVNGSFSLKPLGTILALNPSVL